MFLTLPKAVISPTVISCIDAGSTNTPSFHLHVSEKATLKDLQANDLESLAIMTWLTH